MTTELATVMQLKPSPLDYRTPRPRTPARPSPPQGDSSRRGPKRVDIGRCPPLRRPWLLTWVTWQPPAGLWPASSRPVPPSPTSMPLQGCRKTDNPSLQPVVAEAIKGWHNRAPAPRQADALTSAALARVLGVCRLPLRGRGGRMQSAGTAHRRTALDLAIIGVLADGGLGRSEAAALNWGDVDIWADGTGRLTIQKGNNQVEPQTVVVTGSAARALGEIRPDDIDPASPVFGLTGEALANRVHAAARATGLGDGFSGHSGRIGPARRMVAAVAPNAAVQRQGRWKRVDMVARYTRGEAEGETLKWLD